MEEGSSKKMGVKAGHYFLYDLDARVVYSRFLEQGKETKVKGASYQSVKVDSLAFGAAITDRRVYNPGDTIKLLVASPGCPGKSAHLEVKYAGQRTVTSDSFALDDYGIYLYELRGIEESGDYNATVTTTSESKKGAANGAEKKTFSCDFTVAEHTLSPMLAQVKKQVISNDVLDSEFEITVLNQPYTGSLRVGLYCEFCKVVVEEKSFDAKNGSLKLEWKLSGHTGPFRLEFSTPDGNTASVTLQSTRVEERQEIQVGNLGEIVNMALVPIPDGRSLRGINWAPRGVSTTPVILKNAESEKIEVKITRSLDYVNIYTINPLTGEAKEISKGPVKEGQEFSLTNSAPYQLVFVGCIVSAKEKPLFESRAAVFYPETLSVKINAPERVEPSEEVRITLESNKKAKCLLMIYDERLDTESVTGKLGKDIYNHLRALPSIQELSDQFAERKEFPPEMDEELAPVRNLARMVGTGAPVAKMSMPRAPPSAAPASMKAMAKYDMASSSRESGAIATVITAGTEAAQAVAPRRAWFPKLIACKLVEVDGAHEERIKLGDTITHWKVQVYAFADLDYISQSASVEADKSVIVDLDVPMMMDEGDEYYGKAIYHIAEGKGTLRVKLPDGSSYEGEVKGDGIKDFRLPSPGIIEAELISVNGDDSVTREVIRQASENVTVSLLSILEKGEELQIDSGKKVHVYGSLKALLSDSVRALIQYPHGCAEQTSAKLCGLAIAWQFGETSQEVSQMISAGLSGMTKFLQPNNTYSLWEGAHENYSDVTRKVLKNLAPLAKIGKFKNEVAPLIEKPVQELLSSNVKDNSLLPLDPRFAAPVSTVEDAANIASYSGDSGKRKDALRFIEGKAVEGSGGTEVRWEASRSTWGGSLETTAMALRALSTSTEDRHRALFKKGLKFLTKRLVARRLNSTADTRALIELFASMMDLDATPKFVYSTFGRDDPSEEVILSEADFRFDSKDASRIVALDDEANSDPTANGRKLKAGSRLIVRLDGTETIDYKNIKSALNFEAKLAKTTLKLGERVQLVLTPKEQTICPIVKVFLAANLAFLEGGVNIQTISKPITNGSITLDILATTRGKCKLYTVMYDMYDANMIGISMPIQVTTQ